MQYCATPLGVTTGRKPPCAYQFRRRKPHYSLPARFTLPPLPAAYISLLVVELTVDEGRAWPLIEGTGKKLGMYIIDKVSDHARRVFLHMMARQERLISRFQTDR